MTNLTFFKLKRNLKQSIKTIVLSLMVLMPITMKAQTSLYWNSASGNWDGTTAWSSVSGGTANTTWDTSTDTWAVFEYPGVVAINDIATAGTMLCSKVTVTSACTGVTLGKPTAYRKFSSNTTFEVATGKYFATPTIDLATATSNTLTFTKTGGGEFFQNAGNCAQTFNLNEGFLTLNSVLATLTTLNISNGTTIASFKTTASAQQDHTYVLNVNGNFSLGLSQVIYATGGKLDGFIGFTGAVNLGDGTSRTITNIGLKSGTFSGIISGVGSSLTMASSYIHSTALIDNGAITLSGANTYSGGTVISGGKIYAANLSALGSGMLTLAGGNLSVMTGTKNNTTTGVSVTVSKLKLTENSTLALGTGTHTLTIGNSSAEAWTSGKTLTITGWTGTLGVSGTATEGKIMVGVDGLTANQLAQISFTGFTGAVITASGELVPTDTATEVTQVGENARVLSVNRNGIISNVQGSMQVMTLNGMTLKNEKVLVGQEISLPKGVYIIRTTSNNEIAVQKIVL